MEWRGQATKLRAAQKKILSYFEERGVKKRKLADDGESFVYSVATKYWVRFDGEKFAKETERLNITRLTADLLDSANCPESVKIEIAESSNTAAAKAWLAKHQTVQQRLDTTTATANASLNEKRNELQSCGRVVAREQMRQTRVDAWAERDQPITSDQRDMAIHYLSAMVIMCRLAFSFVMNPFFRMFLRTIRPSFEKTLHSKMNRKMAGTQLDELYEESQELVEEKLATRPGLITLGIDGHKDGRSRTLETITKAKLGISTFHGCHYMLTERATGARLASLLKPILMERSKTFIAVVSDNTSSNVAMNEELQKVAELKRLFYLGCFVHVMDLLVEDISKVEPLSVLSAAAHTVVSFVKRHATIYEEFLSIKGNLRIRSDLHLFPTTRFAYMYLMLESLHKCIAAVRALLDSPVYKLCKEGTRRRGGEEGRKAFQTFVTFESILEPRAFSEKLDLASQLLWPISAALHYLEGDSVPLSHVYPVYQGIYDFVQGFAREMALSQLLDEEHCERIVELVKERWYGAGRKKGLRADVHLLAFILDPYAQGAVTTPGNPSTELLSASVFERARAALRYHITEPDIRQAVGHQFLMWNTARPQLGADTDMHDMGSVFGESSTAVPQGDNAFRSSYIAAMELMWDRCEAREKAISDGKQKRKVNDVDDFAYTIFETIERLKLTADPASFWQGTLNELPDNASKELKDAHKYFCVTARNIISIVGHTCGVERAGKAYGLIMTAHRKHMRREVAGKAAYVLNNYNLLRSNINVDSCFTDFSGVS